MILQAFLRTFHQGYGYLLLGCGWLQPNGKEVCPEEAVLHTRSRICDRRFTQSEVKADIRSLSRLWIRCSRLGHAFACAHPRCDPRAKPRFVGPVICPHDLPGKLGLVFRSCEGPYFLVQLWMGGNNNSGREFLKQSKSASYQAVILA